MNFPKAKDIRVGMEVVLDGGEEAVVFHIEDGGNRATLDRKDGKSGSGRIVPRTGQRGWTITKKNSGYWGSSGIDGILYMKKITDWKKVIKR